MSVMQLKKFFIANAGVTIALVITTAKAAIMPMIVRDVWILCLVIESDNMTTVIDSINQFTIILIYSKRAVQYTQCNAHETYVIVKELSCICACKGRPVELENERD